MIKFVRQKSREHSVKASKSFFKKKGESNDSGTESDGDVLDVDKHRPLDLDMETSLSSCADVNSPTTDTACSSSASSAMMCQSHLLYDQHSSEEELEVINGPSSVAAAEAASNVLVVRGTTSSLISERGSSSLEPEELFGEASTSKRSSSTLVENRKRSLAHSSDDDLRNFLEPVLTPVNFRTSPPLEAFKPNRSHKYRSTTPLILSEARCGIENIKLCDNSVNDENGEAAAGGASSCAATAASGASSGNAAQAGGACAGDNSSTSVIKVCTSSLKMSNSSHHIYQPQPKYNFHYNSSRSSPASTTGLDAMEVRSVSPPAKLFHSARSPHRRPIRTQHATQRLQRPHRPCLDFDKMQQLALPITKTRN
ncbi:PREDICTED: uncharacterized protein LOC108970659 isoform X2 [Bactrocera latifrons]|uniref:uncharacterized protein LOC108970659 isoform X2 n=1 Tax=Bactrocera latifrons TaxID=174628 RepID=UPI0008DD6FE4|nr:PREDICTED: uncharacterized protein LOC108970659 isoform X2 [Bactrocera latifrons]